VSAPLAISVGDPAGVGPSVTARALGAALGDDRALVFGDAERMAGLLAREGVPHLRFEPGATLPEGHAGLVDVGRAPAAAIEAYAPTAEGGAAQLEALDAAADAVRRGEARALVTGPTSKEAIHLAGHAFVGQTEHLARAAGLADDDVTMMFLGPRLRVALVTTHLSIRSAPDAITSPRVQRAVRHMGAAMLSLAGGGAAEDPARPIPIVAGELHVTGLNPHAGEAGLFGDEEARVIGPALDALRAEPPFADGRVRLLGPRPAETVFREAASGALGGVVTMLHDQATIASKILDWGEAVNVTWGLPFVRTSVDHGVAYDAARADAAAPEGMVAAIVMARRLTSLG
jgi:4-hydroxythreonine-4-phosphate dehydrogenase